MEIVTKDFPVRDAGSSEEYPHGSFEVVLSAPTLDRDGEIVDAKAFEPLPDHITFDTDHSMTCDSVVGSGVPSYADDGTLRVKGGYCSDDRSQVIRQKVSEGHIRTTSVTFMAAQRKNDAKGIPHVTEAELLNGTFTPVPSNREAVVLSAKSIVQHATVTKAGAAQSVHDSALSLGAVCDGHHVDAGPNAKTVAGSLEATQDRVRAALSQSYGANDSYVWLRATLPTSCVFEIDESDGSVTYQQDYTDDGATVTLTGERKPVELTEIVAPDPDPDTGDSADPAAKSAAERAADDAAGSAEEQSEIKDALAGALENARLTQFLG